MTPRTGPRYSIAVVGGFLAGLAAGRVLQAAGHAVTVFERAGTGFAARGGGLGVDLALAMQVGSGTPPPHLRLPQRLLWREGRTWREPAAEDVTAYGALWRWLSFGLDTGTLRLGVEVTAVRADGNGVRLSFRDGIDAGYDLAICADGGRGAGRTWVEQAPRPPEYAGYVLWRGLCPRAALRGPLRTLVELSINSLPQQHFVAYPIPTYEGDTAFTAQFINWGWYRPTSEQDAEALQAGPSRALMPHAFTEGPLPSSWQADLRQGSAPWPEAVRALIESTLSDGRVVPHPVREVEPRALASGRIALLGDVAHQASPITGAGARMAMQDALALNHALSGDDGPVAALQRYADSRLSQSAAVVNSGRQAGRRLMMRSK